MNEELYNKSPLMQEMEKLFQRVVNLEKELEKKSNAITKEDFDNLNMRITDIQSANAVNQDKLVKLEQEYKTFVDGVTLDNFYKLDDFVRKTELDGMIYSNFTRVAQRMDRKNNEIVQEIGKWHKRNIRVYHDGLKAFVLKKDMDKYVTKKELNKFKEFIMGRYVDLMKKLDVINNKLDNTFSKTELEILSAQYKQDLINTFDLKQYLTKKEFKNIIANYQTTLNMDLALETINTKVNQLLHDRAQITNQDDILEILKMNDVEYDRNRLTYSAQDIDNKLVNYVKTDDLKYMLDVIYNKSEVDNKLTDIVHREDLNGKFEKINNTTTNISKAFVNYNNDLDQLGKKVNTAISLYKSNDKNLEVLERRVQRFADILIDRVNQMIDLCFKIQNERGEDFQYGVQVRLKNIEDALSKTINIDKLAELKASYIHDLIEKQKAGEK